jgi:class 3 adenylate cyclase
MKRFYYVSRCSRPLRESDLRDIQAASERNNQRDQITGFLVLLGDFFFQVIEGREEAVDHLFHERISRDPRHREIFCLRTETGVRRRQFPGWHMRAFDLNRGDSGLPFAFRQMLEALTESNLALARYTQPSVYRLLQRGANPIDVRPQRKTVTVLFSDIIGFSILAERLSPTDLLRLVNAQVSLCSEVVGRHGGEVNKLLGDGVLAYFEAGHSDAAIRAGLELLNRMEAFRERASANRPERHLHAGVGLSFGTVYEGNIGSAAKQDFTILGNTVNLASRLESLTRVLGVRLVASGEVVKHAQGTWDFAELGRHKLKGLGSAGPVFTLASLKPLDVRRVYASIRRTLASTRRS